MYIIISVKMVSIDVNIKSVTPTTIHMSTTGWDGWMDIYIHICRQIRFYIYLLPFVKLNTVKITNFSNSIYII